MAARRTGTSRSVTLCPSGRTTARSSPSPAAATARTFSTATSGRARRWGGCPPPACTRSGPSTPSNCATYCCSAASPWPRTLATICPTACVTDSALGASARTCAATARGSPSAKRSSDTQALHHLVDRRRLELVRDRVGDEPRRRRGDVLAHDEPVLAQRGARRGEVDDRLDEAGQRRQLDRALDLDDLRLAPRVLKPARRDPRVLRRHAHDAEASQRLGGRIGVAGDAGQDHAAGAVAQVEQLEDLPAALLHQDVLAGDPQVGR